MAFTNALVEIRVGNVEALLCAGGAPVPRRELDRALNPHLGNAARTEPDQEESEEALVYDPVRDAVLNGAVGKLKRLLRSRGYRLRLRDATRVAPAGEGWRLAQGVSLRDYQQEVVERALEAGHGVIDVGTGGGKTLLAAAICARLSLPTLWLVTTRTLMAQTVANVRASLGVEPGVVGDGQSRPAPFTVALVQALDAGGHDLERWRGGTLVFDEGHHAAAASYLAVIRRVDPRYHFYLSAVPVRTGRDQAVLDALAGRSLTDGKYSARYLVEKGYAAPVEARFEACRIEGDMTEQPFATLYRRFVAENAYRNRLVATAVADETARGRSVLVLVDHVRHGEALLALLGAVPFVHGGTPRRDLARETERFSRGESRCLVATAGLFQEGVSIDGIHVLVQAGGLKSRVKVLQAVGRGMRRAPGKESCLYLDFFDDDSAGVFRAHAEERVRVLREEGFTVHVVETPRVATRVDDDIPPSWAHVPGTKRFLLVDAEGRVRAKAECVEKSLVPERHCKRCTHRWCEEGGRVTWRDESD